MPATQVGPNAGDVVISMDDLPSISITSPQLGAPPYVTIPFTATGNFGSCANAAQSTITCCLTSKSVPIQTFCGVVTVKKPGAPWQAVFTDPKIPPGDYTLTAEITEEFDSPSGTIGATYYIDPITVK